MNYRNLHYCIIKDEKTKKVDEIKIQNDVFSKIGIIYIIGETKYLRRNKFLGKLFVSNESCDQSLYSKYLFLHSDVNLPSVVLNKFEVWK